jgi:glycosyltransferase involved in cell wall biosynthesis
MRVAIVHDYLVQGIRGAERVVLEMHECWPEAPVHALLYDAARMGEPWPSLGVRTSWLQRMPGALRLYQKLYLLMPLAVETLRLAPCDVVISSSSGWVKNLRPPRDALHICYCYSPARFLWHQTRQYVQGLGVPGPLKALVGASLVPLRAWDRRRTPRANAFIAISRAVQERIRRYYGRESLVIYPPVDTEKFAAAAPDGARAEGGDYLLVVAALNPYKRVDLAVEACTRLGLPLKVVGDGPEAERLRAMAGPTVELLGKVTDEALPGLYAGCRAFVMPQEEDFGIAPLEAQAAGRPVVAYAAGGALETVVDGETGLLFPEQTAESLAEALGRLEGRELSPGACRANAERFGRERFRRELTDAVEGLWARWRRGERGVLI